MPDFSQIKLKGLYTYPNNLSEVPQGSLVQAQNIVIDADGVIQSRRGFDVIAEVLSSPAQQLFSFQNQLLASYGNSGAFAWRNTGTGWVNFSGTYLPPTGAPKIHSSQANSNFYFTTSGGVKKLDKYNGTVTNAGQPPGLDIEASLAGAGSGFFQNNTILSTIGTNISGSPSITLIGSLAGVFGSNSLAPVYVSGTGIPFGTTVTAITTNPVTFTGNLNSSTSITVVSSVFGLAVGQTVIAVGIPVNTTITAINAGTSTVTISQAATATATGVSISTATSVNSITMSQNATSSNSGTALQFYSGAQVAYRVLFGIKDANNNLILGAPSQSFVLTNITPGSDNATVVFTLPSGLTTANFFQVYRSAQTINSAIQPNDNLQLVYEGNPSSGQLTAHSVTITDNTPDSLRGATIYTASSQEGAIQANYQPPLCVDIETFENCTIYANTTQLFQQNLTMLAVGGSAGVGVGDVITIGGVAFTGGSSQVVSTNTFLVSTSGTPSQNITATANSLVQVINQSATNTATYAYYLSGPTDLPGLILLQARSLTSTGFSVTASAHGSSYNPQLPTSGTTVSATQSVQQNALYISKTNEPEAVPLTNVLFAGSAAFPIKRIIALRDSLFILKDDGIFRMVGQDPTTFYIQLFDNTSKLLAPESVVNLNNTVYCLTNQGVVSMSDTGLSVVSRPIEGDLLQIFGANPTNVTNLTWAVSYQSDRKYILGIIKNAGDLNPTQMYVYNVFTNAWTNWALSKNCGIVNIADNKLYLGDATSGTVNIERKNFNYTDYVDGSISATITGFNSTTNIVTLSTVANVSAGDVLFQASNINSVITSVDTVNVAVTLQNYVAWTNGAATILKAIQCITEFQPLTGSAPDQEKQFSELELYFKQARFYGANLAFTSDLSLNIDNLTIVGNNPAGWGQFQWGLQPWGGVLPQRPIRTYIPLEKQRCSQLTLTFTHQVGYGDFIFNGITLVGRPYSTRTTK